MEEYEEKRCGDCKEKCKFYFQAINNGNIPFGCSKPIESEVKKMRLIDADEIIKTYEKETGYIWSAKGILECPKCFIDNAPTVEPKKEIVPVCKVTFDKEQLQEIVDKKVAEMIERPQGEWVFMRGVTCGGYYKCNKCGEVERAEKNYCPNCGALMMKGGKEE